MKSKMTNTQTALLGAACLALAANLALAGNPNPNVLPPNSNPFGLSYAEWSVKWWQWVFSLPATNSPILDTGTAALGNPAMSGFWRGPLTGSQTLTRRISRSAFTNSAVRNRYDKHQSQIWLSERDGGPRRRWPARPVACSTQDGFQCERMKQQTIQAESA